LLPSSLNDAPGAKARPPPAEFVFHPSNVNPGRVIEDPLGAAPQPPHVMLTAAGAPEPPLALKSMVHVAGSGAAGDAGADGTTGAAGRVTLFEAADSAVYGV